MYKNFFKQFFDTIIATILLIILSPIMLITLILIYFRLGSIKYRDHKREGKNKKVFIMYKIRTKVPNNEEYNNPKKFTKLTGFIDRAKFNEIPQLINVIKGDMALVGPRPFSPEDVLPDKPPINPKRYLVKPGLTGLAQIQKHCTHKEKLEYDVIYYDNLSFWLDLKILLLTPIVIIRKIAKK